MNQWDNEPTPLVDKDIDETYDTYGEAFVSTWLAKQLEQRLRYTEQLIVRLLHTLQTEPDMSSRHRYNCTPKSWPIIREMNEYVTNQPEEC